MVKRRAPSFAQCMEMMRDKRNPQSMEDGFAWIFPRASEFSTELRDEFEREKNDRGLRCWLLELLAESRKPELLQLFIEQLNSEDESFRYWAALGLQNLDSKESRRALYEATTVKTRIP